MGRSNTRHRRLTLATLAGLLTPGAAYAQSCTGGVRLEGTVLDPKGSAVANAQVEAADGEVVTTDTAGHFLLPCVPAEKATLAIQAQGFAQSTVDATDRKPGTSAHFDVAMMLGRVETTVTVGEDATTIDADHGVGTHTLTSKDVQELADDPDDFARQLQVLAATSGGVPGGATVTVDGFQNGSSLPPKSSIASIRVNPDMFSSEYEQPPYEGGRIEIFTKPGADTFHGALFLTDSDGSFNATDPFSTIATPAGKRRYGFELNGPILRNRSDFTLALEKRDIDEFNVVNAVTLDSNLDQASMHQTVAAPERLWIASTRGDWQVTPKNVATLSFSANVNDLGNQGVGGLTLLEAGYGSHVAEYDLRFTNTQTVSPSLLHETHIGFTWKDTAQSPNSSAPAVQVSGYFTGGGSAAGNLNDRERDFEVDDDAMLTRGKHSLKIGVQSLGIFVHEDDPANFNGSFTFGGGIGNGSAANLTPLAQYQAALAGTAGGTPTTYEQGSGTPLVAFTQWRVAVYAQDTFKLQPRLTMSAGVRYQLQTSPGSYANAAPRIGLAWSPDKKSHTVLNARFGIFDNVRAQSAATDVYRLNGVRQSDALVYSPSFTSPLTPVAGSIQVGTIWQFPPHFPQDPIVQTQVGAEHDFPHHWHAQSSFFYVSGAQANRARNINAPLVADEYGVAPDPTAALLAPRPIAPNLNILQYQASGHLTGKILFLGLDQHSYKRFGFFAGYLNMHFDTDVGNGTVFPQSSYSDAGEKSRADWEQRHQFFAFGNLNLPYKVQLSTQFNASSGPPYNVTTGTDANGDGQFNDRPTYATAAGTGVYPTKFGLLSTDTINGNVPRNLGTMPATVHLDLNIARTFKLSRKKTESPRTLALNARSANLLNHTNVTGVSTIISSPTFSQSLSAEAARRIELGARFAF
ncbi:TonB-dependent receptor [Acidipila sp. EB88]|uniref:TonB-dependent receptor n=1 Tax=Acidipila sp. EB88 TaxID=2305226 RepID=UPI000F5EDB20|nr:carboxypeptidase regulatory-like domain-containing protein [Acidipila sp. EB88]RRA47194.1 TonB-dependent receptor [Acidipila sp. EB88]